MRYQLRYAAGTYWLLDTWQEGMPYRRPLAMNEVGAAIWRMMAQGLGREQIVDALSREYQAAREVLEQDVKQFQAQLAEYGINTESMENMDNIG